MYSEKKWHTRFIVVPSWDLSTRSTSTLNLNKDWAIYKIKPWFFWAQGKANGYKGFISPNPNPWEYSLKYLTRKQSHSPL